MPASATPHFRPTDMVPIPGGTFRMGSDRHYPEEAPVHRVTVDGFLIDRTPSPTRSSAGLSRRRATSRSPIPPKLGITRQTLPLRWS
jgi:hypothetical protein